MCCRREGNEASREQRCRRGQGNRRNLYRDVIAVDESEIGGADVDAEGVEREPRCPDKVRVGPDRRVGLVAGREKQRVVAHGNREEAGHRRIRPVVRRASRAEGGDGIGEHVLVDVREQVGAVQSRQARADVARARRDQWGSVGVSFCRLGSPRPLRSSDPLTRTTTPGPVSSFT